MNRVCGVIDQITVNQSLSLVRVKAQELYLSAIVIDTPETCSYLQEGHPITAIFKETEVIIGKGVNHDISLQNRIEGRIITIDRAPLLSKVVVDTQIGAIASIITTRAIQQLELTVGSEVTAMIKTNEVMLAE